MTDINEIHAAQVRAAEDAVIKGLPADMLDFLRRANEKFEAAGGCSGCRSKLIGVHYMPCVVASAPDCY